MAEGSSDLPSLKDGSDADFDIKCTPCGEDNIREEAVKYCQECNEYLCATCTRHHGRQKATRSHKLVDTCDAKHGPVIVTKCLYHPDREIEMYCRTHDMVYCLMCIATEHRSCSGVNKIEDEQRCIQGPEISRFLKEARTAHERMKALALEKQSKIESLEEQREIIQHGILEVERLIIERTKQLKGELLDSLDRNYTKLKTELESEISTSCSMERDLEKTTKQLQTAIHAGSREKFIQAKLVQKITNDANVLHQVNESNGEKGLQLTENTELMNAVTTATDLGHVMIKVSRSKKPATRSSEFKMKSMAAFNIRMSSDQNACLISDACQLKDGIVLLADEGNRKVKRLGTNYSVDGVCDLDAEPTGICVVNESEVAVKMNKDKIQFISVGASLTKTRFISITGGGHWGITCCAGDVWVSRPGGINVYSTTGTLIRSIVKDQNGRSLFKTSTSNHMAVSDDTVIVTDGSSGAVCLNRDGTMRMELRNDGLCAVCVTDDGTVFICGFSSNNIVMFSSDGRCLGELVSGNSGLKKPTNLCYDRIRHCIIATCLYSDNIHIVELSK